MLSKADIQIIQGFINDLKNELKNDIVTFKDQILGEIKSLREEVTIVTSYRDKIEDHEERLEKLEKRIRS